MKRFILAGDIGGTQSRFSLYKTDADSFRPTRPGKYKTAAFQNLEEIVTEFLHQEGRETAVIDAAVFSVAGPRVDNAYKLTNLDWTIDSKTLRTNLAIRKIKVINDLEAWAYSLPLLGTSDIVTLNPGVVKTEGIKACIVPGTGLGQSFITKPDGHYTAFPSEGGHGDFAPRTPVQIDLLHRLLKKYRHVSYERVCSGTAIPVLYEFHKSRKDAQEPPWLEILLKEAKDPVPVIVGSALDKVQGAELCRITLDTFITILGAEAGNLGLRTMATGGVYLGGGLSSRIFPNSDCSRTFMDAFLDKGRMQPLVRTFPVHVIKNSMAGLMGAAAFLLKDY